MNLAGYSVWGCKESHNLVTKPPSLQYCGLPGGSVGKNPPAVWETWVRFLGQEDILEESVTTHSSILAWRIPWTEEPGGLQSTGHKELDTTE